MEKRLDISLTIENTNDAIENLVNVIQLLNSKNAKLSDSIKKEQWKSSKQLKEANSKIKSLNEQIKGFEDIKKGFIKDNNKLTEDFNAQIKDKDEKIEKQSTELTSYQERLSDRCQIIANMLTDVNEKMLVSLNLAKEKVVDYDALYRYLEYIITPSEDNFLYVSRDQNFEANLLAILKKSDTPLTRSANLAWWMEQKELREILVDLAPDMERFTGYFRYGFITMIQVLYGISINLPETVISNNIARYMEYDNGESRISQLMKSYKPSKYDKCEIYRLSYNDKEGACYIY